MLYDTLLVCDMAHLYIKLLIFYIWIFADHKKYSSNGGKCCASFLFNANTKWYVLLSCP